MAEKNGEFARHDDIQLVAMETAECPIDFDDLKIVLDNKFGIEVVLGTHSLLVVG